MESLTDTQIGSGGSANSSSIKVFAMGTAGVVLAGLLGYTLNRYTSDLDNAWQTILYTILPATGFLSVFLLQALFVRNRNLLNVFIILQSLAIAAPFLPIFSWWLIGAWAALLIFFWIAVRNGRNALENQVKIHFFQIERFVIPGALTALSLFISLAYINFFFENATLSKQSFQTLLRPAVPAMSVYVPGFSFQMTMGDLAEAIAIKQLGGQAESIPANQLSFATSQVISYLRTQADPYKITFRSSDRLIDVLYSSVNQRLNRIPAGIRTLVPIGFATLLFLIVKGFALLLRWVTAVPAYILYELAFATGFASLTLESRSREVIILK